MNKYQFKIDDPFSLAHTFECGQCFRFNPLESGEYAGVAHGHLIRARLDSGVLYLETDSSDDKLLRHFFDLDRDYSAIRRALAYDQYVAEASEFGSGIRMLGQDFWEAVCSFIISQCNNIPRIKGIIERLSERYGRPINAGETTYYTFPDADVIADLEPEDLGFLRSGYRAPYIVEAARAVASGRLNAEELRQMPLEQARSEIMKLPGVGNKVASCILLYGLRRLDAFPVDVWMKRALAENYGKDFDPASFGEYAGIAQQYIFFYRRSGGREARAVSE